MQVFVSDAAWRGEARRGLVRRGLAWFFHTNGVFMKFDIDVSDLLPGDSIPQSKCESVIGMRRTGREHLYQFALLQLGDYIQKALWKIGKQYTVRAVGGEVQVLTHEQASKYNDSRFDLAIAKMRRCNRRLMAVDIGSLSKETRQDHERAIVKQSRMLSLLKSASRDLTPTAEVKERIKLK